MRYCNDTKSFTWYHFFLFFKSLYMYICFLNCFLFIYGILVVYHAVLVTWKIAIKSIIYYIKKAMSVTLLNYIVWELKENNAYSWWRHQMEIFSASLALCAGNSPVPGEFPAQRPVTRSFDIFFHLRLNKPLSKQSWSWWFETPSRPLWRQWDVVTADVGLHSSCFSQLQAYLQTHNMIPK